MSKRFTFVTLGLTTIVAFLLGALATRGVGARAVAVSPVDLTARKTTTAATAVPGSLVNFADVVEHLNATVVNIDATSRGGGRRRPRRNDSPDPPEFGAPRPDRPDR